MFSVSVITTFPSFETDQLRWTLPMVSHSDHPLPSAPYRDTRSPPRYDTNSPARCTVHPIQGAASWAIAKRGIGFSEADLLDLAMFNGLSESSEKDADRKPESAAGHLMSSSSAAAHIPGAILYNSL